MYRAE